MLDWNIEVLAVSESCWTGNGVIKIESHTILYSGISLTHVHGEAIILSPNAAASWEPAGSGVFLPISECFIRIRVGTHLGYATITAISLYLDLSLIHI